MMRENGGGELQKIRRVARATPRLILIVAERPASPPASFQLESFVPETMHI